MRLLFECVSVITIQCECGSLLSFARLFVSFFLILPLPLVLLLPVVLEGRGSGRGTGGSIIPSNDDVYSYVNVILIIAQ